MRYKTIIERAGRRALRPLDNAAELVGGSPAPSGMAAGIVHGMSGGRLTINDVLSTVPKGKAAAPGHRGMAANIGHALSGGRRSTVDLLTTTERPKGPSFASAPVVEATVRAIQEREERDRKAKRKGRRNSILTSYMGVAEPAPVAGGPSLIGS